jgi:solute carrier family 8 (sodium/calcium exchanger)
LGFSVAVYTVLAFAGIGLLLFRRWSRFCGCSELGGPQCTKYLTALLLLSLWVLYILLSSFEAYGYIVPSF